MIREQRQARIVSILCHHNVTDVLELARMLAGVSAVTIRRVIAALAGAGALHQARSGANVASTHIE